MGFTDAQQHAVARKEKVGKISVVLIGLLLTVQPGWTVSAGAPITVSSDGWTVWSSWSSYYEDVREEDIVCNADWIAAHLKPNGFGTFS